MAFSGGTYTLPGPALNAGEIVSATENNQFRNDVATAFNLTFLRNGTSIATANLPMDGYKLTGLGAATNLGDALSYGQAATVSTLTASGAAALNGGITVDSTAFTVADTTGNTSIAGTLAVTGVTTLTANPVLNGGTANGVAYLNGSKVLTTGSALTFDGSIIDTNVSGSTALRLTSSTAQAYISLTSATAGSAPFIGFNNGTGALGSIAAISGGGLSFASGNTERARITSDGNFLVNGTTVLAKLTVINALNVYGSGGIALSNGQNYWNLLPAGTNDLYFGYNAVDKAYVRATDGAWISLSDRDAKKDIEPSTVGLSSVMALRPVKYRMKEQEETEQKTIGFIAQEAKEVIPESVFEMKDGALGMDKMVLMPVLVKAIQELKAELDATKAEVAALKPAA